MLVLSRKLGEKIRINSDIEVTVISINGNRVRLGVLAPHDVIVHREEVFRQIAAQEQAEKVGSR